MCNAHLKHGKEQLVDGTLGKLVEDSHHIFTSWPVVTEVKREAFEARLAEFSTSPTLLLAKWLLQISLKLTKDKMGEVRKDSDRRYRAFMEQACTARGASTGHALVKVMVKDKTIMYQQVDDKEALLSGKRGNHLEQANGVLGNGLRTPAKNMLGCRKHLTSSTFYSKVRLCFPNISSPLSGMPFSVPLSMQGKDQTIGSSNTGPISLTRP